MNDIERRLDAVEIKLAHLEDFLQKMQDETLARNAAAEKLAAEHAAVKEKVLQIASELEEIPNRKPPHY